MISMIISTVFWIGTAHRVATLAGSYSNTIIVVANTTQIDHWLRVMPNAEILTEPEYRSRRPRVSVDLIIVDTVARIAYQDLVPSWRQLPCEVWIINPPLSMPMVGWLGT